jgi:Mlc titration factor MtfA (ptsG expression regulator)
MEVPLSALLLILGLGALLVAGIAGEPAWRAWRRQRIAARPFPSAWRSVLMRRMPLYRRLPPPLQAQLRRHVTVFLAEKPFIGCQGQRITDEVRVLVAAQAALLQLNRRGDHFANLRQVLVYPGAFLVQRLHIGPGGVLQDSRHALSGESWSQGQVILSWDDVLEGAADPGDGRNVVLHEFAHQLDQATGSANGAPALPGRAARGRWKQVFQAAYDDLLRRHAAGEPTVINPYGSTDAAEFFAVATESFFEQPHALAADSPALYAELARYYHVDPRNW